MEVEYEIPMFGSRERGRWNVKAEEVGWRDQQDTPGGCWGLEDGRALYGQHRSPVGVNETERQRLHMSRSLPVFDYDQVSSEEFQILFDACSMLADLMQLLGDLVICVNDEYN